MPHNTFAMFVSQTASPVIEAEGGRSLLVHERRRGRHTLSLKSFRSLRDKLCFSDLLLPVYMAGFVRQYFWGVGNQRLAWALTAIVVALLWGLHLRFRERSAARVTRSFWLIVALPLLLIYAVRLPFPDFNFDILNYHLVITERAFRGWPFLPGDFFPGVLQVNPAPDLVSGIYRHLLGYRLGSLVNWAAVIWAAQIIDRLLRPHIERNKVRYVCLLLIVSTEHILYLLNLYMIDLLALPLLLEATVLALRFTKARDKNYAIIHISFFLGLSLAFKLTNLAYALPVVLFAAYHAFPHRGVLKLKYLAVAALVFVIPFVPFSLYMYLQTGNPIFPYYNKLFHSPYMVASNYKDPDHGPQSIWQALTWPVWSFIYPERLSAMNGLFAYTGRLSLAYLVALLGLSSRLITGEVRKLCMLFMMGTLLWSMASGDIRYGLYLELIGGISIILLLLSLYRSYAESLGRRYPPKMVIMMALFTILLIWQCGTSYKDAFLHHELFSEHKLYDRVVQPNIYENFALYRREAKHLFSDRTPEQYLSPQEKATFDQVEVWINSHDATSGFEVSLRKDIPIVSVCKFLNLFDYLETEASRQRLAQTLDALRGRRMFTLTTEANLKKSLQFIARANLKAGTPTPVEVPFYSDTTRLRMLLIEVWPEPTTMEATNHPASKSFSDPLRTW